jgi:hypothetical protein
MFIVLVHWNITLQIYIQIHLDTLAWLWTNMTLLLLLNGKFLASLRNYTFKFTGQKTSKLEYLYRFYWKNLPKVTCSNQFSLAVGHQTTAKVDDCLAEKSKYKFHSLSLLSNACLGQPNIINTIYTDNSVKPV